MSDSIFRLLGEDKELPKCKVCGGFPCSGCSNKEIQNATKMEEKYDVNYLRSILDKEGTSYGITGYLGKIKDTECNDPKAIELWNNAYDAIKAIEKYLEENSSEDE